MYGAYIEIGKVISVTATGATVESLTRAGLVTRELKVSAGVSVSAGTIVYYFMFENGEGLIIAAR